jgi:hypothetical protein
LFDFGGADGVSAGGAVGSSLTLTDNDDSSLTRVVLDEEDDDDISGLSDSLFCRFDGGRASAGGRRDKDDANENG